MLKSLQPGQPPRLAVFLDVYWAFERQSLSNICLLKSELTTTRREDDDGILTLIVTHVPTGIRGYGSHKKPNAAYRSACEDLRHNLASTGGSNRTN